MQDDVLENARSPVLDGVPKRVSRLFKRNSRGLKYTDRGVTRPKIMDYSAYTPHPLLLDCIQSHWSLEEFHTDDTKQHWVHPAACVELTFSSQMTPDALWGVGQTLREAPDQGEVRQGAWLLGLQSAPFGFLSHGLVRVLGVRFYPWGVRRLLGLEPIGAGLPSGAIPKELCDQVAALVARGAFRVALDALETWLLERRRAVLTEPGLGVAAGRTLFDSHGLDRVGALADSAGVSVRSLERGFRDEVGLSPKALARLIRFERCHDVLIQRPDVSLTEFAFEMGFSDQAHFNREFRAFAHHTPGEFARAVRRAIPAPAFSS